MAMSWVIVLAMALAFLLWGLFIFFVVGVSWPPPWRYGTIADVPGQSIYSVRGASKQAGTAPSGRRGKDSAATCDGPKREDRKAP